jgi:S-adenosylmethionine hydrolase
VEFWPQGTVFVSVVDPGVGTQRRYIVAKTKTGHYIVTPDNGTLTLIADALGIAAVRIIDERKNRRQGSGGSYTFHGRDVYAYTGARLASGTISFDEVGPISKNSLVRLPYQKPQLNGDILSGTIPVLDVQYGNVWTNIHDTLFKRLDIGFGDTLSVQISRNDSLFYKGIVPYVQTFGAVREGSALAYLNSLMNLSLAVNMGNFADSFHVSSGNEWSIQVQKNIKQNHK